MDFDLGKMQQMLSQARDMQAQMDDRLAATTVEADAGGGAVAVRMSGKKELLCSPSLQPLLRLHPET